MDAVERLTLEAADAHTLIAVEHIHRYQLAAELLEGLRVVDLACGSGYGSRILRERCTLVRGVDNDVSTIDLASATVGRDTDVEFEVADALEFLGRELAGEFDAIVMFEGLEHLENSETASELLRRQAGCGLKIVVSVPNSKALGEENPYHLTEYGYDEAREFAGGFEDATLLYQFLAEGSLVRGPETGDTTAKVVALERGETEYANHFIVCVNVEAARLLAPDGRMHLEIAPVHNRYVMNLELANRELRRVNARLARAKLGKADSAAASLVAKLEAERRELEELKQRLASEIVDPEEAARDERRRLIQRIEELHDQALAQDRALRAMADTRVWKLGSRYWTLRDKLLRRR